MRKIPKGLMNALSDEFSLDQIEEGRKRLDWIMRVRDRGEDCQVVLDELGLDLSSNSYRKYKGILDIYGIRGLIPKKVPRWKFTSEVRSYVRGVADGWSLANAGLSRFTGNQLKIMLGGEFERQFSLSKTSELMNALGVPRKRSDSRKTEETACENAGYLGFMEAGLQELGLEDELVGRIDGVVKESSASSVPRPNYKNKDGLGRFTGPPGVFKTVDSRDDINYSGHDVAKTNVRYSARKMRELLSFPITTVNGCFTELADSSRTMRKAFCGFPYQPATIDKFLRELKYYDLESVLNSGLGRFWYDYWNGSPIGDEMVFLSVDNKLNHLYTTKNCSMGKIGSTGEIDYCMGGCYLNDQNGHFLCFHPTNGQLHLPVGAEMVLTDLMDGFTDGKPNVAIVGDREMRSVPKLIETKENKDYNIITRVKTHESELEKIQDKQCHGVLIKSESGDYSVEQTTCDNHCGTVYGGTVTLKNSENGELCCFNVEALDRPHIKTPLTVINTFEDNPLPPGETVIQYLNRANNQERSFYHVDRFANGKKNYGYGKKQVTEDMHKAKREELEEQKEKIESQIAKTCADEGELKIKRQEAQKAFNKSKTDINKAIDEATEIKDEDFEEQTTRYQKMEEIKNEEIKLRVEREKAKNEFRKEASDLKNKRKKTEKKAERKEREIEKLSTKHEKYALMTTISMIYISVCQHILETSFKNENIGLETLIEKIFRLPGRYIDTQTERIVYLDCRNKNRNKHEKKFNSMVRRACNDISKRCIKLNDGRLLRMEYVMPP
jgi:hypothetical protein